MTEISALLPLIITGVAIPALAWLFRDARNDRAKNIERLVSLREKAVGQPDIIKLVEAEVNYEHERRTLGFKATNLLVFGVVGIAVGAAVTVVGYALTDISFWWIPLAIGIAVTVAGFVLGLRDYARRGPTETRSNYAKKKTKTEKELVKSKVLLIVLKMKLLDATADQEVCQSNVNNMANPSPPGQQSNLQHRLDAANRKLGELQGKISKVERQCKLNEDKIKLFQPS